MIEILISLTFAILFGASSAIQKYSLDSMKKFSVKKMVENWKWLASLVIGGLGILVYLFALKNFPLFIVQPFVAIAMLVPIACGVLYFNEKLNMYEIIGIVLVIVGVIWVSIV